MKQLTAKQIVDKYVKSFGDNEIPIDEMYWNKTKAHGIQMRNFLEDLVEDVLDQNTKPLIDEIAKLKASKSEATTNELELSVRIRQYIEKTHENDITPESLTKVFLDNYTPKSEANEAVESQGDLWDDIESLFNKFDLDYISHQELHDKLNQFTITRNNK